MDCQSSVRVKVFVRRALGFPGFLDRVALEAKSWTLSPEHWQILGDSH